MSEPSSGDDDYGLDIETALTEFRANFAEMKHQKLMLNQALDAYLSAGEQLAYAASRDDLRPRLKSFARNCVLHGDMTPMGERMLLKILDGEA